MKKSAGVGISGVELGFVGFFILMCVIAMGQIALSVVTPLERKEDLSYLSANYTFLKSPEKTFKNILDDRKREVVFVDSRKINTRATSSDAQPAVLYMAEVEAKIGRQAWLDKAYEGYVLTQEELGKLTALDRAYEERLKFEQRADNRSLTSQKVNVSADAGLSKEDVLESRNVLVAMR